MSAERADAVPDFQRVYDEFHPRIRRYLARLGGAADADDLAQETFARVSQALSGFRGEAAVATWIYRIATNVVLDRARSREFKITARAAEPGTLPLLPTLPVIEDDIARREMSACVRDYVDELPAEYRAVVVLSDLEDLPDRDIAEVLGVSVPAAKIRLHRARAKLREMLQHGCAFSRNAQNDFACEPRPDDVSSTQ